ncbi:helix-turn-helix domain-containing protein [Nocardioides humilatus]|uniref:Helix-turn-helix domain-containing protein n=1 Tax=Nocardioides humilatus TaxID=2607660 RepID=A0A5B1LFH8_9ACTN|nr:response regulator transcription factor [Nocardioides humilatus]KAA1418530.1 helix-turn-helix domain-containing protein [Nocardioides humilatus]
MLESLGIAPDVEAVYRAVIAAPATTVALLGESLGITASEVEAALATLGEVGLVLAADDGSIHGAPPAVALGALITEQHQGLRLAEQALATLAEQHRSAIAGQGISDLIEVVTGPDGIRHRFQQVQHAAAEQLRMFVTAPFIVVRPGENAAETAAVDRGVRVRVVIEQAVLAEPGATAEAILSIERGLEVRVVDRLPMKLVLADDDLALVPLEVAPGGEPGAVLLQRSGLLSALDALFEAVWQRGYPLALPGLADDGGPDPEGEDLSPVDRQVLALLLAGLTDQAAANQLGISLRSLQRRLRHLQDLAGVDSRMQLGWYAARHDWA